MGTKFGVVYGIASNIIHKIIECGDDPDDSHLDRVVLAPGQAMKRFNLADFPSRRVADMQPHIGAPAHSGRCAQVKDGVVVHIEMADHALLVEHRAKEGITLIQHDEAGIGWHHHPDGVLRPHPPKQ